MELEQPISQRAFGELVGVSQQAISGLVSDSVLLNDGTLREWLLSYTENLREQAAGRATSGGINLATERARLASEQADKIALQNKVTRSEFAPVILITEAVASMGRQVASILEALPIKLKRNTELDADAIALVELELIEARNAAAKVLPDFSDVDISALD